jgi:tetratricopeptide (TPR) repeat protein
MKPRVLLLFVIGILAITLLTVCAPDETPQIWTQKGIMNSNLGKYDTAVINFDRALEMDPEYVLAYNGRGMAYLALERYDEALSDFETAIALDPSFSLAYFNRGEAHYLSGDLDEALLDFETSCDMGYIEGCVRRDEIESAR